MADVENMFFQVKVKKEDQNFFCFLCWPGEDLTPEPQEYRVTLHLFRAGLSPRCFNLALERTAEDGEKEFEARAAETLKTNFHFGDALKSVATEKRCHGTRASC